MLDNLIAAGATFDWITPLWTLYQDWRNRPSAGFTVDARTAWSAFAVRDLLKEHGIRTWGWAIHGSVFVFRLRAGQAAYAEYLMDKAGVPWVGSSNYCKARTRRQHRAAPARRKLQGTSVRHWWDF